MKTTIAILVLALSSSLLAADRYTEQMLKNIEQVYKAQSQDELQQAVNALERIAGAEKNRWEPFYYASFGNIMLANLEKEGAKKDSYLDLAEKTLAKAMAINPNESEIVALQGFVHMIRLTIDPAARGQQYGMLSMQSFEKALSLNPNNPRAMALMAQMQFGTAKFFNQQPTEACQTAKKSIGLFADQKDSMAPSWGKGMAESLLEQCQ